MGRAWATYQLFSLLTLGMWVEGTQAGLDMEEFYEAATQRLRVNLIARSLQ